MQTITSAMSLVAAVRVELIRLMAASLLGRSLLRWLPTMTMGTGESCSIKLSAAAVWCMVSVP